MHIDRLYLQSLSSLEFLLDIKRVAEFLKLINFQSVVREEYFSILSIFLDFRRIFRGIESSYEHFQFLRFFFPIFCFVIITCSNFY